jgi:hypothetical protein
MLKDSNWNLANTVEEVLQRQGEQPAAPSTPTSGNSSSFASGTASPRARENSHVRFDTPPTPDRASSPYTHSYAKGTRSENVTPNRRRSGSPVSTASDPGTEAPNRPSPSRYSEHRQHGEPSSPRPAAPHATAFVIFNSIVPSAAKSSIATC